MVEEIAFVNGRISNSEGLVILTLTLDRVILNTVVHHSSTSTCIPSFIEIEVTFCGWTDVQTHGRKHLRPSLLGRLCRDENRPETENKCGDSLRLGIKGRMAHSICE